MNALKFIISGRSELRPNQVTLIGKKKQRRSVGDQVDTGSCSQAGDDVSLPHFAPGACFQADKEPSGSRAVNKIISEKRGGGIAENPAGSRWGIRPEPFGRGPIPGELEHEAADEQALSIEDRGGDG